MLFGRHFSLSLFRIPSLIVFFILHKTQKLSLVRIKVIILFVSFLHEHLRPFFVAFLFQELPNVLNVFSDFSGLELKGSC